MLLQEDIQTSDQANETPLEHEKIDSFFEKLKHLINVHHMELSKGVATAEVIELYTPLITGDTNTSLRRQKINADQNLSIITTTKFIAELFHQDPILSKLAINITNGKILVWAEVKDEDYSSLQKVLKAASIVNSRDNYGFTIRPTVVEDTDEIEIPPHYTILWDSKITSKE